MIKIIADTTCGLPLDELAQLGIDVIPQIIIFDGKPYRDDEMREVLRKGVLDYGRSHPVDEQILNKLLENAFYVESTFQDPSGYSRLHQVIEDLGVQNTLFYLATPPDQYATVVENIGQSELETCPKGWRRIVVEKPFGRDLESAKALDKTLHSVFDEEQIYRMDHYLGKETVQNILAFRFGNGIFEPLLQHCQSAW